MLAVDRLTWPEVPLMRLFLLDRLGGRAIDPGTPVVASFTEAGYFAAYWALIRPTSGLLRRRWLSAIRRRASWTLTESPMTGYIA